MMQTPISAISDPMMSKLSGGILSICQPHSMAMTMKIPPHAARPDFFGVNVQNGEVKSIA